MHGSTSSPSLTERALARLQGVGSAALVGIVAAAAAAPAQAVTPVEPPAASLSLDHLLVAGHNASGWFSWQPVAGSVGGEVFGTLDEGFKLYGTATLPAEQYMFNTYHLDENGWWTYSSYKTGVGLGWSGQAFNVRPELRDQETGELLRESDRLVFNYEFTLQGPAGTQYHLSAGFSEYQPNQTPGASHSSSYYGGNQIHGELQTDGSTTFKGTFTGGSLYSVPGEGPLWWFVELTADSSNRSMVDLVLTVPTHSIDVGINTAPVPEPSAWALALAGVGVLGLVSRRRAGTRHA